MIILCFFGCGVHAFSSQCLGLYLFSLHITSLCLSAHGPHTECRECDERHWIIDEHRASTHLLRPSGVEEDGGLSWGMVSLLWDDAGLWEAAVGTQLQNSVILKTHDLTRITTSAGVYFFFLSFFFSYHFKESKGQLRGAAEGSSVQSFCCPETLPTDTCDDSGAIIYYYKTDIIYYYKTCILFISY